MISSKYFDHTILKAEATEAQVAKICEERLWHMILHLSVSISITPNSLQRN